MKQFCSLIALFLSIGISAQFTEIINSNRPGQSDTPYSVGVGIHQIESGLFLADNNELSVDANYDSYGLEFVYRTGIFFERLEVDLRGSFTTEKERYIFNNQIESKTVSGLSDLVVGSKMMLYEQKYTDKSKEVRSWKRRHSFDKKRLIPTIGIYTAFNTNLVNSTFKDELDEPSLKGALLLQNNLSDRLVLVNNLIIDKIAKDNQYFQHSITGTFSISTTFSTFIEGLGQYQEGSSPFFDYGIGFAYLLSPDLQLDTSFRSNLSEDFDSILISAGVAWRFQNRIPRFK